VIHAAIGAFVLLAESFGGAGAVGIAIFAWLIGEAIEAFRALPVL
jgi:hypothetical protein